MSEPRPRYQLTERQAFDALVLYLKFHADKMHSEDIEAMHQWATYRHVDDHGHPLTLDPREYDEWLDCVETVMSQPQDKPVWTPSSQR